MYQLKQQLSQLRLPGFTQALEQQLSQPNTYDGLSFTDRLELLFSEELLQRSNNKQRLLIKQAAFKLSANLQDIDYTQDRHIERSHIARLAQPDWISKGQNLLITGPCGSGKTHLACAIGHTACMRHQSVRYYRLSRLFLDIAQSKGDGSYKKRLLELAKYELLILDDWGLEPMNDANRRDIMEILDDRYNVKSTIMISQLPTDQWYGLIGDNTMADAILDRLMHNAHRLNIKGESMRKKRANMDQSEHLAVK